MPRYSVKTNNSSKEVVEKALAFFGGELQLEVTEQADCCANFQGGGGHVYINVVPPEEGEKKSEVNIETREWDYQVRQFMQKIG